MKKFIPIVLILMLTGCGGVQTKTVYQDVYIPIPIIPYPPEITEPEYCNFIHAMHRLFQQFKTSL
jgi:hypothetical protein